jgi:uncharacterized membrane protein
MSTPASIAKHPLHPMVVVFPIGLWIFSLVSDFVFLLGGDARWSDVAFYTLAGGLIGALVAAAPGLVDMFSISDPKVGKIARNHMILNLIAVAIFGLSFYLRLDNTAGAALPVVLSVAGVLLIAVSGWLGVRWFTFTAWAFSNLPEPPASGGKLRMIFAVSGER